MKKKYEINYLSEDFFENMTPNIFLKLSIN